MLSRRVLWACLAASAFLRASSALADAGSSILNVPVSARAAALGDGAVAMAEGADMAAVNPAGLAYRDVHELALTYAALPDSVHFGSLFYSLPLPDIALGLGVRTLSGLGLDARDATGNSLGTFNSQDTVAEISAAHKFFRDGRDPDGALRVGGTIRYVSSRLAGYGAQTAAFDAGAQLSAHLGQRPLQFGAALTNVGPGLKFLDSTAALPAEFTVGAAVAPLDSLWLTGGASVSAVESSEQATFGFEYAANRMMTLRASVGYRMTDVGIVSDTLIFAGGMRVNFSNVAVDFAILPMQSAGYQERVGLSLRFGTKRLDRVNLDNAEDPAEIPKNHSGMLGAMGMAD